MSIRRYTCNVRGELNPHAAGDLVKFVDHIQEVAEIRTYFINKLNAVNQIMVETISGTNEIQRLIKVVKSDCKQHNYEKLKLVLKKLEEMWGKGKNESAIDYHGD